MEELSGMFDIDWPITGLVLFPAEGSEVKLARLTDNAMDDATSRAVMADVSLLVDCSFDGMVVLRIESNDAERPLSL